MTTTRRPKGSGTIEKTPDGTYRARFAFEVGGPREDVGTFATYDEAARRLDAILVELRAAGGTRGISLRRLGARALDLREREGYRSVKSERDRWRAYVETWDRIDAPVSMLTRGDVRMWLGDLAARGLAVQTRRNARNLLSAVLQLGVDEGHIDVNVASDVRVKSRGSTEETSTWLTKDEADRLMSASSNDPAVVLAITTGLRSGELRSLLWADVHEDHVVVRYGAPDAATKNGKIRKVPLLPAARAALDALPRTHRMVLPTPTGGFRTKGRLVAPEDWKMWLAAAKITRRVRWHDLRHTCATLLLTGAWGEPWSLEAVKEMLGHSSIKVTERYAKATGSLAAQAARAMHKPKISPETQPPKEGQPMGIVERCGRDSNPCMTVLQTGTNPSQYVDMGRLSGLARAYLEAVAAGSVFAHRHGRELAEAVLEAAEVAHVRERAS